MDAPLLGAGGFGIYRGESSAALPVRLVLEPLRAWIGARPRGYFRTRLPVLVVVVSSALLGAAAFLALAVVLPAIPVSLGTLDALAAFALPAACFVVINLVGQLYYVSSRAHARARSILTVRILQTAAAVALPIGGALALGLLGAIWGFVVSSAVAAIGWVVIAGGRGPEETREPSLTPDSV
jgi:hypothetical protein